MPLPASGNHPEIETWCLPYFSAVGRSSSSEMKTIIPETTERTMPLSAGFQKLKIKMYASSAPSGSESPERKDNQKALRRLPVEW